MGANEVQYLIVANHILHYQGVLDAYGHISMRDPSNPEAFIMSGDLPPALVSSSNDLIHYRISTGEPINPTTKKGYQERFIHSEIYKAYPSVNSVIHSHSPNVLPYTMNGVPMRPAFHIAAFLGDHVPVWDIIPLYQDGDQRDLLVNNTHFGSSLASTLSSSSPKTSITASESTNTTIHHPHHNVVLMANHGFTTIGISVKEAVYRAIYTHINASIQTQALALRSVVIKSPSANQLGEMRFLHTENVKEGCIKMNTGSMERAWMLWAREVEVEKLYRLDGDE